MLSFWGFFVHIVPSNKESLRYHHLRKQPETTDHVQFFSISLRSIPCLVFQRELQCRILRMIWWYHFFHIFSYFFLCENQMTLNNQQLKKELDAKIYYQWWAENVAGGWIENPFSFPDSLDMFSSSNYPVMESFSHEISVFTWYTNLTWNHMDPSPQQRTAPYRKSTTRPFQWLLWLRSLRHHHQAWFPPDLSGNRGVERWDIHDVMGVDPWIIRKMLVHLGWRPLSN